MVTADTDPCVVTMTLSHDKGCPIINAYHLKLIWFGNEWIGGTLSVAFGIFIGLYGLRFLRPIGAIIVGLTVFFCIIILSSVFEFFLTVFAIVLTIVIALIAGICLGVITIYAIWLAIGILGILGGFFLGSLIYELTLMQFQWAHAWGFMSLAIGGVVAGIILSVKYG